MKIDRIRVDAFGRLGGFETGAGGLPGLVVVLGPNEAGKSTLFTFLTTALYGFQPAARERNPQVPWGADEAGGSVRVRLDGGGCAEIERRLRSQPVGKLTVDGVTSDLRNQPLPWVEHVPRTVFRQVFAVTLADLAGLDSETWARIQDKMVGTMGAADLRSARAVAEALEREAGEIWRPTRRGNQRLRDVQAEGRELRGRRSAAHERDAQVRALVAEVERVRTRLAEAREQRQRDKLAVERAQLWIPVRRRRERIAELRARGGDRDALAGLPADPLARLDELAGERARLQRRLDAVAVEVQERNAEAAAFDERARALLARREDVLRLVASAARCAAERVRIEELRSEIVALEGDLDVAASSVLAEDWREVSAADLRAVPIERLRERVSRARALPPPGPATARGQAPQGPPVLAALAVGLALLGWGGVSGSLPLAVLGAVVATVALTLQIVARRRAPSTAASYASGRDAARADVRALLAGLPFRAEHLERPDEALVGGLARLQSLLGDRENRAEALEAALRRVAAVDVEARALAGELGTQPGPSEEVARTLDLELRRAERAQDTASSAGRDARRLSADREEVAESLGRVDAEWRALRAAGEALVPGDPAVGLKEAGARLAAHRRADELDEELERSHPDLGEIDAHMQASGDAAEAWALGDEELARTRARLEAVEEEIERLVKTSEGLARDAAHLREMETVDAVDSAIAGLRELEADLVRERDRKWVLAKLLREADRRFRQEHQPDLLRRASSYLKHLTGGRYERLIVDERGDADLFQIVGPGLPAPVPLAPPVSTGTLEQAYLSLRLAIVDHLDQGGERLPLFVDEVFVNWDRARRARGLEVLAAISRGRQVFVFTCHDGVAADLEARGGALLTLGAG